MLRLLCGDLKEDSIAISLKVRPPTVHFHATSIYRKAAVSGRIGLLVAVWRFHCEALLKRSDPTYNK